jgi:group I intron endonuclease
MAKVYKIINNITEKIYVGKTIKSLEERFKEHISNARKIRGSSLISKSLREYGTINHSIELLEECDNSIIFQREQYWINKYCSLFTGYNIKNEYIEDINKKYWGNPIKAQENISKGFNWNNGISPKNDTREKISKTKKKKYELVFYKDSYGHKNTNETK